MEDSLMQSPSKTLRSMLKDLQEVITPTDTPELLRDANIAHLASEYLAEGDSNLHSSRTNDPNNFTQNELTYGNLSLMNEADVSEDTLPKLSSMNIRMKLRSRKYHDPSISDTIPLPPITPDISTGIDQTYGHSILTFDSTDDTIHHEEDNVRKRRKRKINTEALNLPTKPPNISVGNDQTYANIIMSDSSRETIQYEEAEELVRKKRNWKVDSMEDVPNTDVNFNISNFTKQIVSPGSRTLRSDPKNNLGSTSDRSPEPMTMGDMPSTTSAVPETNVSYFQDGSTLHSDDTPIGYQNQIKSRFSKVRKSVKLDLAQIIGKIETDSKENNANIQGQVNSSNTTGGTPSKSPLTRSSFQTSPSLRNDLSVPRNPRNLTSSITLDRDGKEVEGEAFSSPTMPPSKVLQKSPPTTNLSNFIEAQKSPSKSVTSPSPSKASSTASTSAFHEEDNLSVSSVSSITESMGNAGIKNRLLRKRKSIKLDLDHIIAQMNSQERAPGEAAFDALISQRSGVNDNVDEKENSEDILGKPVVKTPESKAWNNDSLDVSTEDSAKSPRTKSLENVSEKSATTRRESLKNTDPANKSVRSVSFSKSLVSSPRSKSMRNIDPEKSPSKSPRKNSSRNLSLEDSPPNSLGSRSLRSVSLAKSPVSSPRSKSMRNIDREISPASSLRNKSLRSIDPEKSLTKYPRRKSRGLFPEESPANSPRRTSLRNIEPENSSANSPRKMSLRNIEPEKSTANSPRRMSLRNIEPEKSTANSPRRTSLKNIEPENSSANSPRRMSLRNIEPDNSSANSPRRTSLRNIEPEKSTANSPRRTSLKNIEPENSSANSLRRMSLRNIEPDNSSANSPRRTSLRNIEPEKSPRRTSLKNIEPENSSANSPRRMSLRNIDPERSPVNSPRSKSLKNMSLKDSSDNHPRSNSDSLPSNEFSANNSQIIKSFRSYSPEKSSDDSPIRKSVYVSPKEFFPDNSSTSVSSDQTSKKSSSDEAQENLSFSKSKADVLASDMKSVSNTPYSLRSSPRKNAAKSPDAVISPSKHGPSFPTSPSRKRRSSPTASPNKITRLSNTKSLYESEDILNYSQRSKSESPNKSMASTDFPETTTEKPQFPVDSSNKSTRTKGDGKSKRKKEEFQFPTLNKSSGTASHGSPLSFSNKPSFPMGKGKENERNSKGSPRMASGEFVKPLLQHNSVLPNPSFEGSFVSPIPSKMVETLTHPSQSSLKTVGNRQKEATIKSQISLNASKNISSRKEITVLRNQSKTDGEPKETGASEDQTSDNNEPPPKKPREATKQLNLKEFLERMSKGTLVHQEKRKTFQDMIDEQHAIPSTSGIKPRKKPVSKPKVGKKSAVKNFPPKLNRKTFQHFSIRKVSNEAGIMFHDAMEVFLNNLASDLEVIATSKKDKAIKKDHIYLLMKQLGLVSSWNEVYAKVQEFLPYEDWEKLIPTEYAFKKVLP